MKIAVFLISISFTLSSYAGGIVNIVPKGGYVPNEDSAVKIAIAVFIPIFGAEKINDVKEYKATLIEDTWIVEGLVPVGGTPIAEISKKDCKVIRVYHTQ